MSKIAVKLAELRRRVMELEARTQYQRQRTAFPIGSGDHRIAGSEAVAMMEKRLVSLRRSCEILARHLGPRAEQSFPAATRLTQRPARRRA